MSSPIIQLRDLSKSYGTASAKTDALRELDLNINSGEFVAVMGPSGSGKSTLMHILGLLDRPTSGQYFLEGKRVDHLTGNQLAHLRNRKMGFVFQSFNLLPRTSALENVELPLIYQGLSAAQRRQLAEAALKQVGLDQRLYHAPNQLSGGEQQRVAIARALVSNPQVIFADEPTGNLDTKNSFEIMDVLARLNREGRTVILVTHEHELAKYADRVIRLRDGVVENDPEPKLYKSPAAAQ